MMQRIFRWQAALFGAAILLVAGSSTFAADKPLVFGVLNQQSPAKTAERWNPIFKYLNEVTGQSFQLKMGPTVQDTNAMMGRGEFDFVYSNHNFRKEFDGVYKVLARWDSAPIYGVVAVNADSPAKDLKGLAGKRVAVPSTTAFVAYAIPMAAFNSAKTKVEVVLAGTQEGALAQLKARQVDAVTVNSKFLTRYAAQQGMPYREVFISEGYPDLAISVHPRVPKEIATAVQKALLGMKADPRAAAALEASGSPGFVAATERDYDSTRKTYLKSE
jgi:phosphonate transport system substrate-binding protein